MLADEDTPAATQDKISGYHATFNGRPETVPLPVGTGQPVATFVYLREGIWNVGFMVDRQHASPDAAFAFVQQQAILLGATGQLDLQIIVGAQNLYLPASSLTAFDPEPHSDLHSFIKYAFAGGTYTTVAP